MSAPQSPLRPESQPDPWRRSGPTPLVALVIATAALAGVIGVRVLIPQPAGAETLFAAIPGGAAAAGAGIAMLLVLTSLGARLIGRLLNPRETGDSDVRDRA